MDTDPPAAPPHTQPHTQPHTSRLGEGARAQSSERYASMFTHHPHAAYSVEPDGFFTDANPRALEMTGMTLKQVRETHFSQLVHPEDLHLIQDGFDGALAGEPRVVEARLLRPDGGVIDIRCTAIPVIVAGEVVGVHGIVEDTTEAKQLVRQLEEANTAKSLFLATVSHEVRTPLAVLIGATDLLMDADLEAEPDHYARLVHRSSERLMRLVNDILEYSGLEADRTALHPAPFAVRAVVEDVAAWALPRARGRDLEVSFTVEPSVPSTCTGDALRVGQVLTNLVQNAIRYTERGSVDVRVRASDAQPDAPTTWVEITVTDTGIGIAEEHLPRLFEPFTRAAPMVADDDPGIGLGLAISRELVDLMGGRLQASSTVGRGSAFTFSVPLGPAPDEPGEPSAAGGR